MHCILEASKFGVGNKVKAKCDRSEGLTPQSQLKF
jgi:hypothetical protein